MDGKNNVDAIILKVAYRTVRQLDPEELLALYEVFDRKWNKKTWQSQGAMETKIDEWIERAMA